MCIWNGYKHFKGLQAHSGRSLSEMKDKELIETKYELWTVKTLGECKQWNNSTSGFKSRKRPVTIFQQVRLRFRIRYLHNVGYGSVTVFLKVTNFGLQRVKTAVPVTVSENSRFFVSFRLFIITWKLKNCLWCSESKNRHILLDVLHS